MVVEPILDSKLLFHFFNLVNGTIAELHSEASFALTLIELQVQIDRIRNISNYLNCDPAEDNVFHQSSSSTKMIVIFSHLSNKFIK